MSESRSFSREPQGSDVYLKFLQSRDADEIRALFNDHSDLEISGLFPFMDLDKIRAIRQQLEETKRTGT